MQMLTSDSVSVSQKLLPTYFLARGNEIIKKKGQKYRKTNKRAQIIHTSVLAFGPLLTFLIFYNSFQESIYSLR